MDSLRGTREAGKNHLDSTREALERRQGGRKEPLGQPGGTREAPGRPERTRELARHQEP